MVVVDRACPGFASVETTLQPGDSNRQYREHCRCPERLQYYSAPKDQRFIECLYFNNLASGPGNYTKNLIAQGAQETYTANSAPGARLNCGLCAAEHTLASAQVTQILLRNEAMCAF